MHNLVRQFLSFITLPAPAVPQSHLLIDASAFNPDQQRRGREAIILTARNEAKSIVDRVLDAQRSASGVVVIDQDSSDGTPFLAAEAGAVVVVQTPGMSREAALREAAQAARRFSSFVLISE